MTEQELEMRRERYNQLLQEDDSEPEIQYQLALCYLDGDGTVPNRERGMLYLTAAAEGGSPEAVERLKAEQTARTHTQSAGAAEGDDEEPLPELDRSTLPLWLERAEEGDAEVLAQVGIYSIDNKICSPAEGRSYLERAAEQGSSTAWAAMGFCLLQNTIPGGRAEDPEEEAVLCFQNAAELGHPAAMSALADCCYKGTGVPQNPSQADIWRERQASAAMEKGPLYDPALCLEAGLDFYHGVYTGRSVIKAVRCFQQLKKCDDEKAFWGEFYLTEDLWSQNPTAEEVLRLLLPLADRGNPKAEYVLFILYITGILPQLSDRYQLPEGWKHIENALGCSRFEEDFEETKKKIETILPGCLTEGQSVSFEIKPTPEQNDTLTEILMSARYTRQSGKIASSVECVSLILYKLLPSKVELPSISDDNLDLWIEKASMGDARAGWRIAMHDKAHAAYWMEKAIENTAKAEDGSSCEDYAMKCIYGYGSAMPRSRELAFKGFQFLQAIPKDACKMRGEFRLEELRWRGRFLNGRWIDQPTKDDALARLLPLADQNNVLAEQTLLILFAAGVLPQLKERYTGPGGGERIRLTNSEKFGILNIFCYSITVGQKSENFFDLVQNGDFLERCLTDAENMGDIWQSILFASDPDRGTWNGNLFLQILLQPEEEDDYEDDNYYEEDDEDEEEIFPENQIERPKPTKAQTNKNAKEIKRSSLLLFLAVVLVLFGLRYLWKNTDLPSTLGNVVSGSQAVDISKHFYLACDGLNGKGTTTAEYADSEIIRDILALDANKSKDPKKDRTYLQGLLGAGISFTQDVSQDLSNGDRVTVEVTVDPDIGERLKKEYHAVISGQKVILIVSGLDDDPDYITSLEDIPESYIYALRDDTENYFSNNARENWSETEELGGMEYLGSFFLTKNSSTAKNENILYLVYKIDYVIRREGKTGSLSYYYFTAYTNFYRNKKGEVVLNNSISETPSSRLSIGISGLTAGDDFQLREFNNYYRYYQCGYKTLDDLYNYCVNDHTGYNNESTVPGYY